jgi:hypothetical protein
VNGMSGLMDKEISSALPHQYIYLAPDARAFVLTSVPTPLPIPSLHGLDYQREFTIGLSPHMESFSRARHSLTHVFVLKG